MRSRNVGRVALPVPKMESGWLRQARPGRFYVGSVLGEAGDARKLSDCMAAAAPASGRCCLLQLL